MAGDDNPAPTEKTQTQTAKAEPTADKIKDHQQTKDTKTRSVNAPRIVFGLSFLIAVYLTNTKFPPSNVINPVYWILAYSIYASALCGVGALIVELLHAVSGGKPLEWPKGPGFPIYLAITLLTALVALIAIDTPSRFFSLPGPAEFLNQADASKIGKATRMGLAEIPVNVDTDKLVMGLNKLLANVDDRKLGSGVAIVLNQIGNDGLADVVFFLEMLALVVVVFYLIADVTGAWWSNAQVVYRNLVYVDCIVISVHLAALVVIRWGGGIPIVGRFPAGPREAFVGGCIAMALFLQSFVFASVTSRGQT